ncbi:MAG: hypothetical protein WAQ99_17500 [Pyrinomonadaceae bacterium]
MDTPTSKEPDTVETSQTEQKVSTIVKDKSTTVERSETEQKVSTLVKDKSWLDIFLSFASALGTALAVALAGIIGSMYLASYQEKETNLRVYTELMSKREEADTSLRKEMFNSIIANFLKRETNEDPAKEVLNLELLAYNFHDSLDLAPLFKDVHKRLDEKRKLYKNKFSENPEQNEELTEDPEQNKKLSQDEKRNEIYLNRLNKVARDVTAKQTAMLEEAGGKLDGTVVFEELKSQPGGLTVMDELISLEGSDPQGKVTAINQKIRIEVLAVSLEKKELEVRLISTNSQNIDERRAAFTVNYFDFPMIDNVRLPQGFRGAIVLKEFNQNFAEFTFVYFPSSRASLKEKPYYDEILYNLQR